MAIVFQAKNFFAQNQIITQNHNDGAHPGTGACDYSHNVISKKVFYAPCKMKLVAIRGDGNAELDANTYFYESTENRNK